MALDPNIPLSVGLPRNVDVGQIFGNALLNTGRLEDIRTAREQRPLRNRLLEAQAETAEAGAESGRQLQEFTSIAMGAAEVVPFLEAGDINGAMNVLTKRRDDIIARGGDPTQTMQAIQQLEKDPDKLLQGSNQLLAQARGFGVIDQQSGPAPTASARDFETFKQLQARAEQTGDPADIEAAQQFGAQAGFDRPTPQEQANIDVREATQTAQARADIDVSSAGRKKAAELREVRISGIKEEMSTRNRNAARGLTRLNQAVRLAGGTSQGLSASAKLQLAKLFPSIDVTNEAALEQSFTLLALDELQKFKGPTTDFEFEKTQDITGKIGDAATANIAKLNSLKRANWFAQREFEQFRGHTKAGGDHETFAFNFGESVKTRKGVFTLQDIQDTAVDNNLSIEETLKLLNK